MRKTVIFIILSLLELSCTIQQNATNVQGITGRIRWVEGNLMPTIGDTTYAIRSKGIPIQRDIYIFNALKEADAIRAKGPLYKHINAVVVSRVKSDKNGYFRVELAPGKYSVFTLEEHGYFGNTFDGEGYINPFTVHEGEFTEIQILVNYKAYY